MGGLSIWHWLIVLVIVLAVFGTKKIGNIGSDLGKAVRDFKKGLNGDGDGNDATDKDGPQLKADAAPQEKTEAPSVHDEAPHDRSGH